jgi:hypothetical protein
VGRREQYFRFDSEFDGPEPALDDTTKMHELREAARAAVHRSKDIDRAARCAVAQLFIFELESEDRKEDGKYACTGHVLCRLRSNSPALGVLLRSLRDRTAKISVQSRQYPLGQLLKNGSCLDGDGNFRLRVSFEVSDKPSQISIRLEDDSSECWNISGSPYSIRSLVAAQQLDACFGRADHAKRKRGVSIDTPSSKRRRL